MNPYFREYKIRAYAKGYVTCLHIRQKDGRYIEKQVALRVDTIRSIEETYHPELGRGIKIDCGDIDIPQNYHCYGADMKQAAIAITAAEQGNHIQK